MAAEYMAIAPSELGGLDIFEVSALLGYSYSARPRMRRTQFTARGGQPQNNDWFRAQPPPRITSWQTPDTP